MGVRTPTIIDARNQNDEISDVPLSVLEVVGKVAVPVAAGMSIAESANAGLPGNEYPAAILYDVVMPDPAGYNKRREQVLTAAKDWDKKLLSNGVPVNEVDFPDRTLSDKFFNWLRGDE